MIYEREILKGKECPPGYQDNLLELLVRSNKFRDAYGRPCTVTSGFRSREDQIRIYQGKTKIPWSSPHLYCQAIDLADPKKEIQAWVLDNIHLMEEIGLWFEDFAYTPNWVHFQIVKFASYKEGGTIFFKP